MADRIQSQAPADAPRLVLVDLCADPPAALRWAQAQMNGAQVVAINKADLRWAGKLESLRRVRSLRPDMFALYSADIALQSARSAMILFGAATGARRIVMGDAHGGLLARSRIGALSLEPARLAAELAVGYGVIVPVAWCMTLMLDWFAT